MAEPDAIDEQRLAFGQAADLYDDVRPSYPAPAIDAIVAFAGLGASSRVLEIGAGTGKATVLLAERGCRVVALEPNGEMARIARRNCAGHPAVDIVESDFEHWQATERFSAIVSAQAWHWVTPSVRYRKAHDVLDTGGTLAAIWTFPDWESSELRSALCDAYRSLVPRLAPDFPMHPCSEPTSVGEDWLAETNASGGFTDQQFIAFPWVCRYTSAEYVALLKTQQDHILMEPDQRDGLLEAVTGVIDAAGGTVTLHLRTTACCARAS